MQPYVTITSLDSGGELKVTGSGTMYTYSGTHLLPSTLGELPPTRQGVNEMDDVALTPR